MFDVYIHFREDDVLFTFFTNVSEITYEPGFFRIHVDGTRSQDDSFVSASLFTLKCSLILEDA